MKTFYTVHDNYTLAKYKTEFKSGLCVYANSEKQAINILHKNNILDRWHFHNTTCECCSYVDCYIMEVSEYWNIPTHVVYSGNVYAIADFAQKHPKLYTVLAELVEKQ